nr:oxidoreductase-like domain-containing protein 1 [Onthophagus taurus]
MIRGKLSLNLLLCTPFRGFCTKSSNETKTSTGKKALPEPPTNCCMSGCANCVWLDYADALTEYFKDGGKNAVIEIEKTIDDPMMKAFLMHELRMRKK